MRKKILVLILFVGMALGICNVSVFAEAGGQETITLGREQLSGKVTGVEESKSYQFTIAQSGRVTWQVLSYVNYTMILQDAEGHIVWTKEGLCSDNAKYRKDTLTVDLVKGTYYLKFIGVKRIFGNITEQDPMEGTWQITTGFTGAEETYPEPNNNNSQAAVPAFQKNITGQIAENDDRDIYKLTLNGDGRLVLAMTSYMKYYTIDLSDAAGKRVWKSEYNEWNENMGGRSNTHQLDLLAGTYYMEVSGKRAADLSLGKATGIYVFNISYIDAEVNHTEPNNEFAIASKISSGKTIKGQIALNDSCDIFQFTLNKKMDVRMSMTSYMRFYCLYIYDSNGNQRWSKENNQWNINTGSRKDDYTISLEKGTYYLKVTGNEWREYNPHTGNYSLEVIFDKINIQNAKIKKISDQVYTGKVIKPQVTMTYDNVKLKNNTDYTVSASRKNIGTAKLTIKGKGNYTGSRTVSFRIVPKKPVVKNVKNEQNKAVTLTWNRDKTVTGYEICRSVNKNKGYKKVKTIKGNKTVSFTDTGLKKGRTYYYKIRSYKTVSGKKYYSSYSKVKTIKIQR